MYTGIQLRAADTLRAPFDPVGIGFARLARAPHVVHAPRSTPVSRAACSSRSPACRTSAMSAAAASGPRSMGRTGRVDAERRGQAWQAPGIQDQHHHIAEHRHRAR